jgi:hypothetical protein
MGLRGSVPNVDDIQSSAAELKCMLDKNPVSIVPMAMAVNPMGAFDNKF